MRDLRSLVLTLFSCYSQKILCRPSSLSLMVLGIVLVQGIGLKEGYAQSIPVLPPLAPASVDVDDLRLDEGEARDRGTAIDSNEIDAETVDADINTVEDVEGLDEGLGDGPLEPELDDSLEPELDESLEPGLDTPLERELDESLEPELGESLEPDFDAPLEPELDESLEPELDESLDPDVDAPLVEDLGELDRPDESLVDDLEGAPVDVDILDRGDPINDSLNGIEDLLPIEGRDSGDPIPPQVDSFKPRQRTSIFENVVLTPNVMTNPTTLRGISGGPLTASRVAGRTDTATGICTGFVDRKPDHRIELTEFFDYLNLQVESPEDTVLVVRGPGGSWCNDDVLGFNPGLAGEWFSGVYDVWVGSYNEQTYHPYVIRLSDTQ